MDKSAINWNHFKKIPVLLWHAPFPLPYYEDAHKTENQLFSRVSFAIQNYRYESQE